MTVAWYHAPLATSSHAPLYQQLQQLIRGAIEDQRLRHGDALPPERDLATHFSVSRITVRKALEGLVREGLLSRRQGAGTFVSPKRVERQLANLISFSEDITARGRTPSSRWISKSEGLVTPGEALTLGLGPGAAVYRFHRIRYADGQPTALEYSTIAGFALDAMGQVDVSLYAALDATGHRPVRALQRLRATIFDTDQARLMQMDAGAPGLLIDRHGYLADGRPVEMTRSWYRGDAYDFVAELRV